MLKYLLSLFGYIPKSDYDIMKQAYEDAIKDYKKVIEGYKKENNRLLFLAASAIVKR